MLVLGKMRREVYTSAVLVSKKLKRFEVIMTPLRGEPVGRVARKETERCQYSTGKSGSVGVVAGKDAMDALPW